LLNSLKLLIPRFAVVPRFQSDEKEGVIARSYEAEQAEANNAGRVLNTGRICQSGFDFPHDVIRALKRSSAGELQIDVQIALIFVGKKTRRNFAAKPSRRCAKSSKQNERNCTLPNQYAAKTNITVRSGGKNAVKPGKETLEKTSAGCSGPQQQGGKRRAKRKSVERRKNYRDGDGYRELLVKAASDAGDESCGNENGGKHQRDTHDGAGNFFHGFKGGRLGGETFFDVSFDGLHNHDGVINHQTYGKDESE
jgi:hypothetical protein